MRAIGVTEYGGPDALHEIDVEPEELGEGQVLVRVHYAAVNPTDTVVRSGARASGDRAPGAGAVPGMDASGILLGVGPGVETDLEVGDAVMAIVVPSGTHGAYRDEVVVPAASVTRIPDGATPAGAATLLMNALTARLALDSMGLVQGQTVGVTGAAGAFGAYVVQLAKADGLTIVADTSEADEALVMGLGAHYPVPRGPAVADQMLRLVPGGLDGLADGSVQGPDLVRAVKDGGVMTTVRGWDGEGETRVRVVPVMVREVAEDHAAIERLRDQASAGQLSLRVAEVLPASEAAEAHRRLEAGGVRGRLVLDFT